MKNKLNAAYIAELTMRGVVFGVILSVMFGYVYGDGLRTFLAGMGISLCTSYAFAFIRVKTVKFSVFFIWHIFFAAAAVLCTPSSGRVICAVILTAMIIDSVIQMKKSFSEGNKVHFSIAAVFLAASYASRYNDMFFIEYACFVLTSVFMALYFMRTGFYNTQKFIEYNDNGKGVPLNNIKFRSYILTACFGISVGIFMVLFRYMGGEFIIKHIGSVFYAVASVFARWIVYRLRGGYVENPASSEETDMFGMVKEAFEERQIPAFIEIIEKIIRYFFIAAIIIGFVFLAVWLVFKLYSIFGNERYNKQRNTASEFIRPGIADKTSKRRIKNQGESPVQNKVRRYYKRYIKKKLADKELSQSKTPYEISGHLGLINSNHDSDIRRIYEKARYSQQECTKEEIQAVKNYAKGREIK